jgi:hypothetical protein
MSERRSAAKAERWTCPACKVALTTPFCPACGEEPLAPHDLTLRGVLANALFAITSIDARTARSAWTLLRRPGELTLAWTTGVRKPYISPFQLFLIANVLFFALQWLTGETIFSSSLDSHLFHQDWSNLAQSLLAERLATTQASFDQYALVFDRAVVLNAKSLILLMAVPFALLLPLIFFGAHRPFMTHMTFSLHLYTFLLLLLSLSLVLARFSAWQGWGGLDAPGVDNVLSVVNLAGCAAYLYVATRRVYGAVGVPLAITAVLLALAVAVIVLGYRFVMFLVTLYAT